MNWCPIIAFACLPILTGILSLTSFGPKSYKGKVVVGKNPVAGAKVRVQANKTHVLTNKIGQFALPLVRQAKRITAWKKGFAIDAISVNKSPLVLKLKLLPKWDNPDYHWIDPTPSTRHAQNCANCHVEIFNEWSKSAHGRSATDHDFLAFFRGQDWNVKKENPLGAGVCASCHAPTYRDPTLAYDLTKVQGVAKLGVHCDYCHKITDAPIDKLGTRFGKDGYQLLRNEMVLFGPLDDAFREGEMFAYSPIYRESRYCASCHEGVIFGVHAYGTFSEWKESPAAKQGKHCQSCHMTPTGNMTNIAPRKGGVVRDAMTLSSHQFPGGTTEMLRRCIKVSVKLAKKKVVVALRAENVGHRVPTGFIDRHLVLVVEAFDGSKQRIRLKMGSTLPKRAATSLAGLPGWLYAKQLFDEKGNAPIPFWLPVAKVVDSRLEPDISDRREFWFRNDVNTLRVRVIYRRFWDNVSQRKKLTNNEIIVFDKWFH